MNDHPHVHPDGASAIRPLTLALVITASFTVIEFVGGVLSDSLALMSDAGHMLTDSLALLLSLGALRIAMRPPTKERTFGFLRAEILAALVNGSTLIIVSLLIFYEAVNRLVNQPEIDAPLMLLVAVLGLAANASGIFLLHDKSRNNLNIRGAFLHMFGDLLSSVAVVVGALLIMFFDVRVVDPVLSVIIGVIILGGAWKLVTQSTSILLESVPSHIDLDKVKAAIMELEGSVEVHDLHVWTLSSGRYALSAHIVVKDRPVSECGDMISSLQELLKERFAITHTTFQMECASCGEDSCVFNEHR